MLKVSEMMIAVGGAFLKRVESLEEMQARLEMVKHAWNLSLFSRTKREAKLRKFIRSQKPYAPNKEALLELEWEYKRTMRQRETRYPSENRKIVIAEAMETSKDNYIIRAYFETEKYEVENT